MKVAVVTTFSRQGYKQYAKRMIETFDQNWPKWVDLHVYPDTDVKLPQSPRIYKHLEPIPEKAAFMERNQSPVYGGKSETRYNYRFDARKFCHKPFALWHFMHRGQHSLGKNYRYVIWLDADTVSHTPIPENVVQSKMCERNTDFLYLGRPHKYSECGFMVFKVPRAVPFMDAVMDYYLKDTFRDEVEWHDSWLFDQARIRLQETGGIAFRSLTEYHRKKGGGHPFNSSFLGQYLDHLKGDARKNTGRPRPRDNYSKHKSDYWKRLGI